jgi:hypothetical protein
MSDILFSTVNRKQFSWFYCQINTELHVCNNMWETNNFRRNWQKHEFKREQNGGIIFLQYTLVNQRTK